MTPSRSRGEDAIQVALLRGINVGRARRVAMADLRSLVEGLGFGDVRTLLNSGNVVYRARDMAPSEAAERIQRGVAKQLGVASRVIVVTAGELAAVVTRNPLVRLCENPSRMFVAFLASAAAGRRLQPLLRKDWGAERLALGTRAAWLWCPDGMLASRLYGPVNELLGEEVTVRNWATVTRLHEVVTGLARP